MPRKEHHVVPNSEGWGIKKNNGQRSIKNFDRKQDAVDHARGISINQQSELIIHKQNGVIHKSDSHGSDPCPPKDKK